MVTYTELNEEKLHGPQVISEGSTPPSDHLNRYNRALDQLERMRNDLPTYDNRYEDVLQGLFDDLANYERFQYDTRGDALYQAYKQSYTDAGRMAMMDTMGQAAALTGGYSSSYGQSVGQQQYNAYLQRLNEVLPETYAMAYQQHQDRRDALQSQYDRTRQQANDEYQRYQDRMDAYYQERDYWQDNADREYDRYQQREEQEYDRQQDDYNKKKDAYDRLADLIMNTGYNPTDEELAAAGMSRSQYQAYLNYYNSHNVATTAGGSGGGRRSSKKKSAYDRTLDRAKRMIDNGVNVEDINGRLGSNPGTNGLTKEETREIMGELSQYAVKKKKLK